MTQGSPKQSDWDVSVHQLKQLRDDGAEFVLVDVRLQSEVEAVNLGGLHIPLAEIAQRLDELDREAHIVVHCKLGGRSAKAVELLRASGFDDTWNLAGGIFAWIDEIEPDLPKY